MLIETKANLKKRIADLEYQILALNKDVVIFQKEIEHWKERNAQNSADCDYFREANKETQNSLVHLMNNSKYNEGALDVIKATKNKDKP